MPVELLGQGRLDRGQNNRHVLRPAAGHHGVDRDLLDRALAIVRRHQPEHLGAVPASAREHAFDPLGRRRHDRQAVRPAAGEAGLDIVLLVAELDPARPAIGEEGGESLDMRRLDVQRAAARTARRQIDAQLADTGHVLPLLAVPADRGGRRGAILPREERRHDLDPQSVRERQVGIVHGTSLGGKHRVVLGHDEDRSVTANLRQDRFHHLARRAVLLDHRDQTLVEPRRRRSGSGECLGHGRRP